MQSRYTVTVLSIIAVVAAAGLFIAGSGPKPGAPVIIGTTETSNTGTSATVTALSVTTDGNFAGAAASKTRTIHWSTSNFPTGASVNVKLLREVNDRPVTFELVSMIGTNVPNNGSISWTPTDEQLEGDNGADLYIEVACTAPEAYPGGCAATGKPVKAL